MFQICLAFYNFGEVLISCCSIKQIWFHFFKLQRGFRAIKKTIKSFCGNQHHSFKALYLTFIRTEGEGLILSYPACSIYTCAKGIQNDVFQGVLHLTELTVIQNTSNEEPGPNAL